VGDVVYAPLEQPDYTKGYQATARYDATTLAFIDAVVVPQHQNSFVAVDPETLVAYSMDGFDGDAIVRYDVTQGWKPLTPMHLSEVLYHVQGASIRDGSIWFSTSDAHNDLYRASLSTGTVTWIGRHGHPGGEGEGIDVTPLPSGYIARRSPSPSNEEPRSTPRHSYSSHRRAPPRPQRRDPTAQSGASVLGPSDTSRSGDVAVTT
jgi:hypothetical protein